MFVPVICILCQVKCEHRVWKLWEKKFENDESNWMKTTGMDIDKKIPTSANLCFTRSSEFYCAVHCKAPHIIGFAIAENKTNTPTIISAGNRSWLMMGLIDKLIEAKTNFFGQIAIWNHFSLLSFLYHEIFVNSKWWETLKNRMVRESEMVGNGRPGLWNDGQLL